MKQRLLTLASLVFLLGGFVAAFTVPAVAAADTPLTIKTMKVSLWPEYEDSRVLVIYEGEFNESQVFPRDVGFAVPTGVEVNQVCALQPPDDTHLCQLYETVQAGSYSTIDYNLPIPTYYLEYYWDGISVGEGGAKSLSFTYDSPYEVETLTVEVQQPARATNFALDKTGASVVTDSAGLNYYRYTVSNVVPGQVIDVNASYIKTDNQPSYTRSASGSVSASGGGSGYGWVYAVAAAAVLIVGFMVFRRRPAPVNRAQARRAARAEARQAPARPQPVQVHQVTRQAAAPAAPKRAAAAPPAATPTDVAFCPYCGTKLASGAAFCHGCGADMKGLG